MPVQPELLGAAEAFLEQDPDILVPVEKVWRMTCSLFHEPLPSLEDFLTALIGDQRFEVLPDEWLKEGSIPQTGDERQEMLESVKPVVKLRRIQLSASRITSIMAKKVEETISLLMKAWELRPADDDRTEDQLLHILLQAQKLQQELQTVVGDLPAAGPEGGEQTR